MILGLFCVLLIAGQGHVHVQNKRGYLFPVRRGPHTAEVLLQRRASLGRQRYRPLYGDVKEQHESPLDAASRWVMMSSGLHACNKDDYHLFSHKVVDQISEHCYAYFVHDIPNLKPRTNDLWEFVWTSDLDLVDRQHEYVRHALEWAESMISKAPYNVYHRSTDKLVGDLKTQKGIKTDVLKDRCPRVPQDNGLSKPQTQMKKSFIFLVRQGKDKPEILLQRHQNCKNDKKFDLISGEVSSEAFPNCSTLDIGILQLRWIAGLSLPLDPAMYHQLGHRVYPNVNQDTYCYFIEDPQQILPRVDPTYGLTWTSDLSIMEHGWSHREATRALRWATGELKRLNKHPVYNKSADKIVENNIFDPHKDIEINAYSAADFWESVVLWLLGWFFALLLFFSALLFWHRKTQSDTYPGRTTRSPFDCGSDTTQVFTQSGYCFHPIGKALLIVWRVFFVSCALYIVKPWNPTRHEFIDFRNQVFVVFSTLIIIRVYISKYLHTLFLLPTPLIDATKILLSDGSQAFLASIRTEKDQKFFDFLGVRYIWCSSSQLYRSQSLESIRFQHSITIAKKSGLSEKQVHQRRLVYGPNTMTMECDGLLTTLTTTMAYPLNAIIFIYTFRRIALFHVTILQRGMNVFGYAFSVIIDTMANLRHARLTREALETESTEVTVFRQGRWRTALSAELVPGDMVRVEAGAPPCDLVIVEGSVVVDESQVSGESRSVLKTGISPHVQHLNPSEHHNHFLYSGTMVEQFSANCCAMVVAIAGLSARGKQVRMGIYKQPDSYQEHFGLHQFYIPTFGFFVVFSYFLVQMMVFQNSFSYQNAVMDGFIYTFFWSPSLCVAILFSQYITRQSMNKGNIRTLHPNMTAVVGSVNAFVFDKTGTLTEDKMTFVAMQPVVCGKLRDLVYVSPAKKAKDLIQVNSEAFEEPTRCAQPEITTFRRENTVRPRTESSGSSRDDVSEDQCAESLSVGFSEWGPNEMSTGSASGYAQNGFDTYGIQEMFQTRSPESRERRLIANRKRTDMPESPSAKMGSKSSKRHRTRALTDPPNESPLDHAAVKKHLRIGIGTCHSLVKTFENSVIGNSLEKAMVLGSGIEIPLLGEKTHRIDGHEYVVRQRFHFDPIRQTSAVLVHDGSRSGFYVKGSFDRLAKCADLRSLPSDLLQQVRYYLRRQHYVLAIGYKEIPDNIPSRHVMESGVQLIGLLIFHNRVDACAPRLIAELRGVNMHNVMCTGDDPLIAASIAQQIGILPKKMAMGYMVNDQLVFEDTHKRCMSIASIVSDDWQLAITSQVFHHLVEKDSLGDILMKIKVFSRMQPMDKVLVIEALQKRGMVVGMCGDGWNDSGAIQAAHVGISLNPSIVSSFTMKSIGNLGLFLRVGAASMESHKLIYFWTLIFTCNLHVNRLIFTLPSYRLHRWSPVMYIFAQIICPMLYLFSFAFTTPAKHLTPVKRFSKFFDRRTTMMLVIIPVLMYLGFTLLALDVVDGGPTVTGYYQKELSKSIQASQPSHWDAEVINYEIMLTFFMFLFMMPVTAFGLAHHSNRVQTALGAVVVSVGVVLLWGPPSWFSCAFKVNCDAPTNFRWWSTCFIGPEIIDHWTQKHFQFPTLSNSCRYLAHSYQEHEDVAVFPGGFEVKCQGLHNCMDYSSRLVVTVLSLAMVGLTALSMRLLDIAPGHSYCLSRQSYLRRPISKYGL